MITSFLWQYARRNISPRADRRALCEPSRWRHKVSPGRKAWGQPRWYVSAESPARWAGRMSANTRLLITLVGTNHCLPTTPFSKFHWVTSVRAIFQNRQLSIIRLPHSLPAAVGFCCCRRGSGECCRWHPGPWGPRRTPAAPRSIPQSRRQPLRGGAYYREHPWR